jgi:TetR/AcrR family transcriptional regulator
MKNENDVQQRILSAALKEFSVHGLNGARIETIAKAANINKAMIFYYFASKENLYQLVIKNVFQQLSPGIAQLISSQPTPELFLEKVTEFYVGIFSKNPDFVRMEALELIQNPKNITSAVTRFFQEKEGQAGPPQLIRLLKNWVEEKRVTEEDPFQFMLNIVSLSVFSFIAKPFLEGIFRLSPEWTPHQEDFSEKRFKSIVHILKRGMLT